MPKLTHFVIFAILSHLLFTSCRQQKMLLKPTASIDTLHLELDLRLIQQYEYKQALLQKMTKFVEVYNTEEHLFKLSLNSGVQTTNCHIKVARVKFIGRKENLIGTAISVAGIGTAATLIATGFAVPFGWIYIPSSRTSLEPQLSSDISEVMKFQRVAITSTGMYRSLNKQIDLQSTKFVKYAVSVVQSVENEYGKIKNVPQKQEP
jgi:hypothetical protein